MEWQYQLDKVPNDSLLISTSENTLIRFYCPIQAKCIHPVAGYKRGDTVMIQGIYQSKISRLLYLIGDQFIPHHHFHLTL
jgi:hypothetical protein